MVVLIVPILKLRNHVSQVRPLAGVHVSEVVLIEDVKTVDVMELIVRLMRAVVPKNVPDVDRGVVVILDRLHHRVWPLTVHDLEQLVYIEPNVAETGQAAFNDDEACTYRIDLQRILKDEATINKATHDCLMGLDVVRDSVWAVRITRH